MSTGSEDSVSPSFHLVEHGAHADDAHTGDRPISYIRELARNVARDAVAARPRSNLPEDAAARRLIAALVARGVDTFFGIPGGPICPVFEAIRLTPGARLIESRHESHAGFAAALYQRASGRVPALV